MATWKLCFVLLLPLTVCFESEVSLVKTISSKPDVTPVCNNTKLDLIVLMVCKIRTERNREECRLLYRLEEGFEHECDSRFTFMMKNQTIFLHLTGLTPVDSGNYTCECSHRDGTDILHLTITVEVLEDEKNPSSPPPMKIPSALIGVTVIIIIIITGVILGFICKTKCNRDYSRSATSGLSGHETPGSLDKDDTDDPYTSLQRPTSDLYQTISNPLCSKVTDQLDDQETDGGETDSSCEVYGNI